MPVIKRPRDVEESDDENSDFEDHILYQMNCKRNKVLPLDFKSFVEEKEKRAILERVIEREREIVRLSKQTASEIIKRAIELAKPDFTVSSFGRIQRKKGGRHFQKTKSSGYSNQVELEKGEEVQVHALVHVIHNDPTLEGFKPGDTVNHLNHIRDDNDSTNHEWASVSEQNLDQIRTDESKASKEAKQGTGRICFVETDKYGKELGAWSGMYPSSCAVSRETGHGNDMILIWLCDGKHHIHKKTGKYFKYDRLPLIDDGVKRELRCMPKGNPWIPKGSTELGLMFSDDGLYRTGPYDELKMGTRTSGIYQNVWICGEQVGIHDVLCWTFHGPPPSPDCTSDHRNRDLDENGFLSNRVCNIRWLDASGQGKNRGNISQTDGQGTPVLVTTISDGTTVTYKDNCSAAVAAGVCHMTILRWCKKSNADKGKRYELAPQPDLVKTRAKTSVVGGLVKLVLTTQKEEWKPAYKEDWLEGGKYFKVRGEKLGPRAERHTRREAKRAKLTATAGPSAEPSSSSAGPSSSAAAVSGSCQVVVG